MPLRSVQPSCLFAVTRACIDTPTLQHNWLLFHYYRLKETVHFHKNDRSDISANCVHIDASILRHVKMSHAKDLIPDICALNNLELHSQYRYKYF